MHWTGGLVLWVQHSTVHRSPKPACVSMLTETVAPCDGATSVYHVPFPYPRPALYITRPGVPPKLPHLPKASGGRLPTSQSAPPDANQIADSYTQ